MSNKEHDAVIIVRKKGGHGGHHGGAWKVAYADFVTAMMAFFLVMWLVSQKQEVKSAVGGYFRDPGIFEFEKGRGVLPGGQPGIDPGGSPAVTTPKEGSVEAEQARFEATAELIRHDLTQIKGFDTLRDQVKFSVTSEGLRIDLVDKQASSFFDSGSSALRGESEQILALIAHELSALTNDVVVEGHTDSRQYAQSDRYGNWELSAERANAARRVMELAGLRDGQIRAVRGYADRQLQLPKEPLDPRNRRVSIVVRSEASRVLEESLHDPVKPLTADAAGDAAAAPRTRGSTRGRTGAANEEEGALRHIMVAHPTDAAATAAQRMEALGRLAGGVAHDFNNVLMVISGYAEMLAQTVGDDPDAKDAVQTILEASERAGSLTRQLLLFSRRQSVEPADVAMAPAVQALEKMLRRLVPEDVSLTIEAADPGLVVRVDPGQLDQIVMNLVANARDAMPTGGRLTIRVEGVYRPPFVDASGETTIAGEYVRLAVSDTGAGMDDAVRARIFEPFFTTKGVGKGTGLGLATVYGIVKGSGGYLDVRSVVGEGTTFEVYFPLSGETALIDETEEPAVLPGRETILVAEDDGVVRGLLQRALTKAGYTVVSACNGREAVALARSRADQLDLVLADLVMPEMGGRELLAALRAEQPNLRALLLSAHTEHAALDAELDQTSARLLRKPCRPRALLQAVREALDQPPTRVDEPR